MDINVACLSQYQVNKTDQISNSNQMSSEKRGKKGSHLDEFFHDVRYFNTSDTSTGNEEDTEDVIGGGMVSRRRAVVGRDKWARRFARQTEWACVCGVTG